MSKPQPKANYVERFFVALKALIAYLESSAIDLVSATTPWLAPVIPASQTYLHAINSLKYSEPIAFVAALAVEFLGLAAVSTAVEFWNYNDALSARKAARVQLLKGEDKKRAKERRVVGAPFKLAAGSGLFYIAVILTVNVLLDWGKPFPQVAANVLLSLLAVPAAVIIAIRSQHRRKLTETRRKPASVTESGLVGGGRSSSEMDSAAEDSSALKSAQIRPATYAEYVQSAADRNGSGPLSAPELLALGVGHSSAYEWPKRYAREYQLVKVGVQE
jgi:hypothetical protein